MNLRRVTVSIEPVDATYGRIDPYVWTVRVETLTERGKHTTVENIAASDFDSRFRRAVEHAIYKTEEAMRREP